MTTSPRRNMFEDIRHALNELLHGNLSSTDRRDLLREMKDSLVHAKLAVEDHRDGVRKTEAKLKKEREELETVRRRRALAEGIQDQETVEIATRFETQYAERVSLLERKLDVEQGELSLLEREVDEMTRQFKSAANGASTPLSGLGSTSDPAAADPLDENPGLDQELQGLKWQQRRAASEADADARLAELKRKMGL